MNPYHHRRIEKKWQSRWQKEKLFAAPASGRAGRKPKRYILDMFPYPSGEGLHVGHLKGYIGTDVYSRFCRMRGFNVLHPMGFDAFGLPAENFALQHRVHPERAVKQNIKRYKKQLSLIGFDYDWSREIRTIDPDYYRFTQWIFLQFFKRGLAYQSFEPINWCPSCQTGLANEDVEGGRCERCGAAVARRPLRQWVLKITAYAERLLTDLDRLDWPEPIKEIQRNWIGRSEGVIIPFKLKASAEGGSAPGGKSDKLKAIEIFTTRPDTILGVTFIAVSPELAQKWLETGWSASTEAKNYINEALRRRGFAERGEVQKKTGVFAGFSVVNPANQEVIPVWIADYVLADYGTGAIMAVPAYDERDREFAEKFSLPIVNQRLLPAAEALKKTGGRPAVRYKLRDWVFSRQRYWGEPIPLVHCQRCGVVPVPESDLPVKLPRVKFYQPTGTGESPLVAMEKWVRVKCPRCGGLGRRETNTMPQWAGSSWYYLRYADPRNRRRLLGRRAEKYWLPVDLYVGGAEHAARHLIYSRFWHKFLYDIGAVSSPEPFIRFRDVGLILAEDGRKMSKRFGNVVNPDAIVKRLGADTLRVYEMFMGPFGDQINWSGANLAGARRFLERTWRLAEKTMTGGRAGVEDSAWRQFLHRTIKKVTEDIEKLRFNTAISRLMIYLNELEKRSSQARADHLIFLRLLAPFAPHLTEEIWREKLGRKGSIHLAPWPVYRSEFLTGGRVIIAIQINGVLRDRLEAIQPVEEEEIRRRALLRPMVKKWLNGKLIQRVVYVKDRLLNLVVGKSG